MQLLIKKMSDDVVRAPLLRNQAMGTFVQEQ
jgi:hypothetical protein